MASALQISLTVRRDIQVRKHIPPTNTAALIDQIYVTHQTILQTQLFAKMLRIESERKWRIDKGAELEVVISHVSFFIAWLKRDRMKGMFRSLQCFLRRPNE